VLLLPSRLQAYSTLELMPFGLFLLIIHSTSYSSICNNPRSSIHLLLNQNTWNQWSLLQSRVSWSSARNPIFLLWLQQSKLLRSTQGSPLCREGTDPARGHPWNRTCIWSGEEYLVLRLPKSRILIEEMGKWYCVPKKWRGGGGGGIIIYVNILTKCS
jgi:hypothetical protein